ncbi:MAG: hypothetical protein ACD_84C00005G0005 [uncultured bacterium]|nr:MAG: hypothetical protein ACD_84C00005G0005 [uncultured bacterium]
MFVFSIIHVLEDDEEVKQILVFPSKYSKQQYDKKKAINLKVSDDNSDVIYKLCAIKQSTGKYAAVIRLGCTGSIAWENTECYFNKSEHALSNAYGTLRSSINSAFTINIRQLF